jgi:hypothetical protein
MQNYINSFLSNNTQIEKPKYRISNKIIFIIELNENNYLFMNDLLIQDYFLNNIPLIETIIYNKDNIDLENYSFEFNTNNIKVTNDYDFLKKKIINYDKIFYSNTKSLSYFSFQNWLYFIHLNNIKLSYLYYKHNNEYINCNILFFTKKYLKKVNLDIIIDPNKKKFNKNDYEINLYFDFNFINFKKFKKKYKQLHNINSNFIDLNNKEDYKLLEFCHKVFFNNYRICLDDKFSNINNLNDTFCDEKLIKFKNSAIIIGHAGWGDVIANSGIIRYYSKQFTKIYYFTYDYLLNILNYLYKDVDNLEIILFDCNRKSIYTLLNHFDDKNYVSISIGHANKFSKYINYLKTDNEPNNFIKEHDDTYFELLSYNKKKYSIHQSWCFQNNINISVLLNLFYIKRDNEIEDEFINNIINKNICSVDKKLGLNNLENFSIKDNFTIIHDNSFNKNIDNNWNTLDPNNINHEYINCKNIINLSNLSTKLFDVLKLFEHTNNKEIHLINSIWLILIYHLLLRFGLNKEKKIYIHQYCRDRRSYTKNFYYPKMNNFIEIFEINKKKQI